MQLLQLLNVSNDDDDDDDDDDDLVLQRVCLSVCLREFCSQFCFVHDTRCCFNMRSKADMSQLNLPHGNDN